MIFPKILMNFLKINNLNYNRVNYCNKIIIHFLIQKKMKI